MRLIVDANVVLSAALRDGAVRRDLATTSADLFAPAFLRTELEKHLKAIARRAGVRLKDARIALDRLLVGFVWVTDEELQTTWREAERALGHIDSKDIPYLACALFVRADAIWSFDKDFDEQQLVPRIVRPIPAKP
jgi:predicted nucleic acid-binding protein